METTANNFEGQTEGLIFEDAQSYFSMQTDYFPGPGDDDNNDDGGDNEDNGKGNNSGADDDNPPIDEDVVHSPLTTESGGKPKTKS